MSVVVKPSLLNRLGFCPLALYYDLHEQLKPTLRARFRMFVGKLLHWFRGLFKLGFIREKLLIVEDPELGVVFAGKPDNYKVCNDHVLLEEFKSKRQPPPGKEVAGVRAWLGDLLQTLAYTRMLQKTYGKPVKAYLVYIDGRVEVPFMYEVLKNHVELYKKIASGYKPDGRKTGCSKCQYTARCREHLIVSKFGINHGWCS